MAIAITQRASSTNGTTSGGSLTSSSFTPTANSRLFVFAIASRDGHTATRAWSITDTSGRTWTKLAESTLTNWETFADYGGNVVCWYTDVGASPAAMTVTVDPSATGNDWMSLVAFDVTGHDTSTPFPQAAVANGAAVNPVSNTASGTLTLGSAPNSANTVLALFGSADGINGFTVPSGYTALTNQAQGYTQAGVFHRTGSTVTTAVCSDLGDNVGLWAGIIFELKVAAAGGTTGTGSPVLAALTAAGAGVLQYIATGAAALAALVGSGSGTHAPAGISGSGSPSLAALTASGSGQLRYSGTGTPALHALTCSGSGVNTPVGISGSGTPSLSALTLDGSAIQSRSVDRLAVHGSGRYLVDGAGSPWLISGDVAWSLEAQLDRAEVNTYLDDRQARGINAILFEFFEHQNADNPPNNAYGVGPFTTANDLATPNEAYWRHVDYIIGQAAARGMVCFITPTYLGFGGGSEGWYSVLVSNGATKVQNFGAWIGARYKSVHNIVWVAGGDYLPPSLTLVQALVDGIKGAGDSHLWTAHWAPESLSTESSATFIDLNAAYTYLPTHQKVATGYAVTPAKPVFLFECSYEGSWPGQTTTDDLGIRRQHWAALLAGACGSLYGNHGVWSFPSGWATALASSGISSYKVLCDLLRSIAWQSLVPDSSSALVTAGRGTITTDTYVNAAKTANGNTAVAYLPAGGSITIAFGAMTPNVVRARWMDPGSGAFTTATGSPFVGGGSSSLTSPGTNSAGDADWVLVLDDATPPAVSGTGSPSLAALTASGAGQLRYSGSGAATLGALAASGAGVVSGGVAGNGAPILAPLTASGAGVLRYSGTGAPSLAALTLAGSGSISGVVSGPGALTLTPLTASGAGVLSYSGSGSPALAPVLVAGAGLVTPPPITGSGALILSALVCVGSDAPLSPPRTCVSIDTRRGVTSISRSAATITSGRGAVAIVQ